MPVLPFDLPPGADILGAMITPAVLISASGTLVMSTTNRIGRVVDRVRVLTSEAEKLDEILALDPVAADEKKGLIVGQLGMLTARIQCLQPAVVGLYTAIGFLVAASISLGVTNTLKWANGSLPVGLGLCGATALFYASVLLVKEARLAVKSTLVELEYTKRVIARKTGGDQDRRGTAPDPSEDFPR